MSKVLLGSGPSPLHSSTASSVAEAAWPSGSSCLSRPPMPPAAVAAAVLRLHVPLGSAAQPLVTVTSLVQDDALKQRPARLLVAQPRLLLWSGGAGSSGYGAPQPVNIRLWLQRSAPASGRSRRSIIHLCWPALSAALPTARPPSTSQPSVLSSFRSSSPLPCTFPQRVLAAAALPGPALLPFSATLCKLRLCRRLGV